MSSEQILAGLCAIENPWDAINAFYAVWAAAHPERCPPPGTVVEMSHDGKLVRATMRRHCVDRGGRESAIIDGDGWTFVGASYSPILSRHGSWRPLAQALPESPTEPSGE